MCNLFIFTEVMHILYYGGEMLSDLSPENMTIISAVISLWIFKNYSAEESNAINNLLALITSNLSVQLAQQALIEEKNNKKTNGVSDDDITPLVIS